MFRDLLGLIYPTSCLVCEQRIPPRREKLCVRCEAELPFGIYPHGEQPLEQVFWGRVEVRYCWAWLRFRKGNLARTLLHRVKYGGSRRIGRYMGMRFGHDLLRSNFERSLNEIDCIVPIPLHPKKQRKRGFNQAEAIAKGMSTALSIPVRSDILKRKTHKGSLTALGRMDRWDSIQDNYDIQKKADLPKHIMIVDDVVTTGATIESCAALLKENGVTTISVATLAYAEKQF